MDRWWHRVNHGAVTPALFTCQFSAVRLYSKPGCSCLHVFAFTWRWTAWLMDSQKNKQNVTVLCMIHKLHCMAASVSQTHEQVPSSCLKCCTCKNSTWVCFLGNAADCHCVMKHSYVLGMQAHAECFELHVQCCRAFWLNITAATPSASVAHESDPLSA